jgi:hypothetical protein
VFRSLSLACSQFLHLLRMDPVRIALAAALLALVAAGTLLGFALVRGARAEAFRVAIAIGEGHLTLLPEPSRGPLPTVIADPGPLYTQPALMRSGALVVPRFTLPIEVTGPAGGQELAVLRGLETETDPQALLLAPHYVAGKPLGNTGGAGQTELALGADLAKELGVDVGGTVTLRLEAAGAPRVTARVTGILHTGREEWDAHGLWSGLPLARAVRGIARPQESEAVTHVALFLDDPASSGEWKARIVRMTLPDNTAVKEWWQLDLEPLGFAPQAESSVRWPAAVLALLAAGIAANLLLGPAPLPRMAGGALPSERELRVRILAGIAVQALAAAAAALAIAGALILAARVLLPILGTGPLHAAAFLPPSAGRLGRMLNPAIVPAWSLGDAAGMALILVVCAPLASAVRLWRIEAPPRR